MNIAFIGNQGGDQVYRFYSCLSSTLVAEYKNVRPVFSVWLDDEKRALQKEGWHKKDIYSFQHWVGSQRRTIAEASRISREYRWVDWSSVIAAERSFTDYSQLLGSAGERVETHEYVMQLLVNIITYLESVYRNESISAIVCQTSDTLFSLVAIKVAQHFNIRVNAVTPAWLLEQGKEGGFFSNTEFLESETMQRNYHVMMNHDLDDNENDRVSNLIASIQGFKGKSDFHNKMKGASAGTTALSPNWRRVLVYIWKNYKKNKNVDYMKVDTVRKIRGNILRVVRKYFNRRWLGNNSTDIIPECSVFYAMHYQPEQSTLAQSIYNVNQVALVENISKSIPFGYTLIVKEHPWGRGNRPTWQYRHLSRLYNVIFCDAPAKEIIRKVDAVVSVTGTVAMESLVMGVPTIVMGRSFFNHSELLFKVRDIHDLPEVLKRILLDREYEQINDKDACLKRFLLSYLVSLVPYFPTIENAYHYARALAEELSLERIANYKQINISQKRIDR